MRRNVAPNGFVAHLSFVLLASCSLDCHAAAIDQPSVLIGWGNGSDAINTPNDATNVVAVSAGPGDTLWLNRDGTVRYQGRYVSGDTDPAPALASGAASLTNIVAISMGYQHALALTSNGMVVAWGVGTAGEDTVPASLSNVTAVAAGGYYSLALVGGRVVAWGDNRFGQLEVPAGLSNVIAISASKVYNSAHNLALKSDGTVVAWGENFFGQCAVPAGLSNVVAISAGWYHSLALKSDGSVTAWGGDSAATVAVPAGLSNVTAISAGAWHSLALKADSTMISWGGNTEFGLLQVPESFTNAVAVSAGQFHNLAILTNGTPRITSQPNSVGVYAGSENSFSVSVKGVPPFTYQWQREGVDLPGETNNLLYLSNVQTRDIATFAVKVSNVFGTVSSEPFTMNVVPSGVVIWAGMGPSNTSTYEGGEASFSVMASGSEPLSYQWYETYRPGDLYTIAIPGANTATLTLTNIHGLDGRGYFARVSNDFSSGWVMSRVARLTVTNRIVQPLIIDQPRSDRVFVGARMGFTVSANGIQPLSYQWNKDGNDLPGETNLDLAIPNVQPADAGDYKVYVRNAFGTTPSVVATLTVSSYAPPAFPSPGTVVDVGCALPLPAFTNVAAGGALLSLGLTNVIAVASGYLHAVALRADGTVEEWGREWERDGVRIVTNVLTGLSNVAGVAAGTGESYAVLTDGTVVAWAFGTKEAPVPVTKVYGAIALSARDRNVLALKSDGRVVDIGNGQPLPGVSNAVAIAAGIGYHLVANADGTVTYIGPGPVAFHPPTNTIGVAVGTGLLALTSDGTVDSFGFTFAQPPSDLRDVRAISSAYSGALALKNDGTVVTWGRITAPDDLKDVSAIAAGGLYNLALTPNPPPPSPTVTNLIVEPLILDQPRSDRVFVGARMGFTVSADGIPPLSYQWNKNGGDLAGETNADLAIPNVQPADAGDYKVYVRNAFGVTSSVVATLTVSSYTPPAFPSPGTVVDLGCALPLPAVTNVVPGALLPLDLTNVVAMASGFFHAVALRADGTVEEWGREWERDGVRIVTNVLTGLLNVVGVAAGKDESYAVLTDGTVVSWAFGTKEAPVPVTRVYGVIALSARDHNVLALKSDGRVVDIGNGQPLPGVSNAVAIATGISQDLVACADGTVTYFGPGPISFHPPTNTVGVAVGAGLLSLTSEGKVFSDSTISPLPEGLSDVRAISGAYSSALALKNDGTVVAWGRIRAPNDLTHVSAIAAGGMYNLALTTNPPPPRLAAATRDGQLLLSPSVSVSGYALEVTDDLSRPYTVVSLLTNIVQFSETNITTLNLPLNGSKGFYRLRRF